MNQTIRRVRLWLLYKVAVLVWREARSMDEFIGQRKAVTSEYLGRANPYLYREPVKPPIQLWLKLCKEQENMDQRAREIAARTQIVEDKLLELSEEWEF